MNKTQELLEAVRVSMGGATNYALSKTLHIHAQTIKRMAEGSQPADAYACARIAMILKRDPLEVIAEVEADSATTPERKEFWKSVNFGLRRTAAGIALSVIFGSSIVAPRTGNAASPEPGVTSHNGRLRQRPKQKMLKTRRPEGRFFLDVGLTHARRKSRHRARKSTCHGTR